MPSPSPFAAPALLMMPHYLGTLAAARCLGQHAVDVLVAADRAVALSSWSRHVRRRFECPAVGLGPRHVADWLLGFGRQHPGAVLYPTSDDMAWLMARYADPLREHFFLFSPPASVLRDLLDKSRLYERCVELGIPVPRTWRPRCEDDLADIFAAADGPLLLKPRAQMFFPGGGKGERLTTAREAREAWKRHRTASYARELLEEMPDLTLPLIQEFVPTGTHGTYSVSGFIDEQGVIFGARASTKVLQNPPLVGVGLCFVASEVDPVALQRITALCEAVGYYGVFEVEFVRRGDTWLLVDFNPRYYGQMGFDIARGAPLPWLVHCAALGARDLANAYAEPPPHAPTVYHDRVALTWRAALGLVSGVVDWAEAAEWHRSAKRASVRGVDSSWDEDDPLPTFAAALTLAFGAMRHPRAFARSLIQGKSI